MSILRWLPAFGREGRAVRTVAEEGLAGSSDTEILCHAQQLGAVVLTHDSDFGTLAVRAGEPCIGITYLRPGHIRASFVLAMTTIIERRVGEVEPPFVLVAERRGKAVRLRLRSIVSGRESAE